MFFRKYKQVISMALASTLLLTGCSAASQGVASGEAATSGVAKEESNKDKAEPVVIRYGSHAASEEDPNYKDPVTGEYVMDEETRAEKLKVLEHIRETLNVDFQFVQFPGDTGEVLLQSVLAGEPNM